MDWNQLLVDFRNDDLIYWFVPVFLVALALEFFYDKQKRLNLFEPKDTRAS